MPDDAHYRGFTALYNEPVGKLITPVNIQPILTTNKALRDTPVKIDAFWDTGAAVTCIKPALWNRLELCAFDLDDSSVLTGVGGSVVAPYTLLHILLAPNFRLRFCQVYTLDFPGDADLLIGMDIIMLGDFVVCNADGKASFSFAMPPFPDRIDLVDKADAANKGDGKQHV
jgi:hypothetical protein